MSQTSKPDLFKSVIVGLLGTSDKLAERIEKGLTDIMSAAVATDWESDVEDVVASMGADDQEEVQEYPYEIDNVSAVKITSASMEEAMTNLGDQVSELDELGYIVSSINTVWEVAEPPSPYYDIANPDNSWVVVSYITYE